MSEMSQSAATGVRNAVQGQTKRAAAHQRRRYARRRTPEQTAPRLLAARIDSLYLSSFIDGIGIDWDHLAYAKEKLRATPGVDFAEFKLGGEEFALKRWGRKPYSYVLKNRAFELQLGERIEPRCHAQFSSELLWREGFDAAIARYRRIWTNLGARETRPEVVARVDAAFDFAIGACDFGIDDFVSVIQKDSQHRENRNLQTASFGKDDVRCRVYDKVAEIEQQSEKFWLFDIWGVRESVWRCEFQIRGPRLRDVGIATIEQLRAHLPGLVATLARQHTSLRVPNGDSNRSRWPLHPMWHELIASTDRLIPPPKHAPPPLLTGVQYPLDRRLVSLLGDLKGIAALLSRNCPERPVTFDQLLKWLGPMLRRRQSPEIWRADVIAKIRKRELGL